jgi:hypothetical protein
MVKNPDLLDTIRTYYKGCNTGDVALMKSTFTPDVIHYFSAHGPIKGADNLALYWQGFNTAELQTTWTVDHGITDGDETVIEWSMNSTFGDCRPQEMLRGTEWYRFSEGKIAEIRAYYRWNPEAKSELWDFPYAERGFPILESPPSQGE